MQYAGNVLVYGAMSPCDGDWFGGVNDSNAAEFLSGVLDAEVCRMSTFEAHYPCVATTEASGICIAARCQDRCTTCSAKSKCNIQLIMRAGRLEAKEELKSLH